jgi:hypothetical protein
MAPRRRNVPRFCFRDQNVLVTERHTTIDQVLNRTGSRLGDGINSGRRISGMGGAATEDIQASDARSTCDWSA